MAGAIMDVTSEDWGTDPNFFRRVELKYGIQFDLDVAANHNWSMCDNYITKEEDALNPKTPWEGHNIWVNPPYGKWIPKFLTRAIKELDEDKADHTGPCKHTVFLLPAKTDTKWYHELVLPRASEVCFIEGRLSFRRPNGLPAQVITVPSILVLYLPLWVKSLYDENPYLSKGELHNKLVYSTMRNKENVKRSKTMGKF